MIIEFDTSIFEEDFDIKENTFVPPYNGVYLINGLIEVIVLKAKESTVSPET